MASSFFLLFDDIATMLDDVATMTKVAAKKTAGVLGDDLALNAQQVTGVQANRELPVVWAVTKGSLINKVILVPAALLLSVFLPQLIMPLLVLGGLFLCFEGFEKVSHSLWHPKDQQEAHDNAERKALSDASVDMVAFEKEKIKGAVRTDFILSAEIIVIALGTVAAASLDKKIAVLVTVALAMTIGVYGLVAGIVKLDDLGLYLTRKTQPLLASLGRGILWAAPWLMRLLSIAGTVAMFLVGGSIVGHGWPWLHHTLETLPIPTILSDLLVGLVAGAILVGVFKALTALRARIAIKP